MYNLFKMIAVLLYGFLEVLFVSTVAGAPRIVPKSPCPSIFNYERINTDSGWAFPSDHDLSWRGVVFVPPSIPIFLKIKLSIPAALQTKYVGKLELAENKHLVLNRINQGNLERIKYHVYFPAKVPLPKVQSIEVNSHILCSSSPALGRVKTTITLEHSLLPFPSSVAGRLGGFDEDKILPSSKKDKSFEFSGDSCGKPFAKNPVPLEASVASRGSLPWIVPLFKRTELGLQFLCSASLITRQLVVTAAHCIQLKSSHSIPKSDILAYVGRFNIRNWTEEHTQPREIGEIFIHPDYNPETLYSDIAVLKLSTAVVISQYVNPVCIWPGEENLSSVVGRQGVVFGWGMDGLGNRITATPKLAVMPIVSQEECLRSKMEFVFLTSNRTFCAGFRNGTGPCNGDSGGGLLLKQKSEDGSVRWYLRGLVSLSLLENQKQMCNVHEFTVFTDVAKFKKWILQLVDK